MFYWLIAFTATFLFQVSNVYVANIVFFVWILIRTISLKTRCTFNKNELDIFFFYLGWVLFSMLIFALQYRYFEMRNIIQYVYNFQYIILIADGSIDKNKLRNALYVCSYLLAVTIIGLWIIKTGMMSITDLVVNHREWAEGYIGGWPNSTVLPLIFGIYVEMKAIMRERKIIRAVRAMVLLFAVLLCTSRTGYVGVALVIVYFLFTEREGTKPWWKFLKHAASILMVVFAVVGAISVIAKYDMGGRMFMVADRMEIISDMFAYIWNRPITGYGGNTVDIIYKVVGRTVTGINWGHTHNTILELLIRHGIIGMLAFVLLVLSISKRITEKDDKVMYWLFWALSVLQIFYKDFVFLLLVFLLVPNKAPVCRELRRDRELSKGKI